MEKPTKSKYDPYFMQINIWDMRCKDEPDLVETINLEMEDPKYGDDNQALYLTGEDKHGNFVEVVVTVPERHEAVQRMAKHMDHEAPNCETCKEFKNEKVGGTD